MYYSNTPSMHLKNVSEIANVTLDAWKKNQYLIEKQKKIVAS